MTPEQAVAIVTALTALVAAIGAVFVQIDRLHRQINSRMTELLDITRSSARAEGVLDATAAGLAEPESPQQRRPKGSAST